jgi:peptidoglycan/LPS O-acetylase OafA/YrhL
MNNRPERESNNFDFLRLFGALLVIAAHSYGFFDRRDPFYHFTAGIIPGGRLGVYIFFLISGYLITRSWINQPEPLNYFRKRILRIYPALIVVVLLSVFVIGPVFTTLAASEYFGSRETYYYLLNISLWKIPPNLPGVFLIEGREHVVNAPLWTLFYEVLMYFSVALFGLSGLLNRNKKMHLLLLIPLVFFYILNFFGVPEDLYIMKINVGDLSNFYVYFHTGVFFYLYRIHGKIGWIFILLFSFLFFLSIGSSWIEVTAPLFFSALLFKIAFLSGRHSNYITRHGDFSYGLYLYGYIVQNILYQYGATSLGVVAFIILSILLTVPFAVFSWYAIESRALKLKNPA